MATHMRAKCQGPRPILVQDMRATLTWLRDALTRGIPPHYIRLIDACTHVQEQLDRSGTALDLPLGYVALEHMASDPLSLNGPAFRALFGDLLIERELKTRREILASLSQQ